jgi:DNA-binding beta-propeller fold protein YncE
MWGSQGYDDGQFQVPTSIAFDQFGNIYVAEVEGSRVQIFNSAGTFLSELAPGTFSSPHGLAFDSLGNLYVGNTGSNSVLKFKPANLP